MDQPQLGRFGNRRLAATGDDLLAAMQKQRTMCLHALAGDRSERRRFNASSTTRQSAGTKCWSIPAS